MKKLQKEYYKEYVEYKKSIWEDYYTYTRYQSHLYNWNSYEDMLKKVKEYWRIKKAYYEYLEDTSNYIHYDTFRIKYKKWEIKKK